MKTIDASPHAATLIESFRDVGYSLETALADIIDNSITARASKIDIFVDTLSDSPSISVIDDGCGMSKSELWDAMRPGAKNPLDSRAAEDLGRFGLGLKTASFSQCRKLTVFTSRDEIPSAAIWDLDYVRDNNKWEIIVPDDVRDIARANTISNSGTVVRWDNLDRLVEKGATEPSNRELNRRIDEVIDHLRLVFHRFLASEPGHEKISISVNNRELTPIDPFNVRHSTADPIQVISLGLSTIRVQTYTLPHHGRVSAREWKDFETPIGYRDSQGFYVYRARRLIISGTWFGLARKEELTKLARVRVDIPNTLDSDWKIDVKKASAHPPPTVRRELKKIIDRITATSKRVYTGRAEPRVSRKSIPVWKRVQSRDAISYEINRSHPAIARLTDNVPQGLQTELNNVVEIIQNGIPIDSLFSDYGSDPTSVERGQVSPESIAMAVDAFWKQMVVDGPISGDDFEDLLAANEPFASNWDLAKEALSALRFGGGDDE